ncbi:MAG: hypothetical protein ACI8TQ_002794 [Planctomycetota bacterium]|jgi:hypothetical protein
MKIRTAGGFLLTAAIALLTGFQTAEMSDRSEQAETERSLS